MLANPIKHCHKPTARNSKVFKKNVRNAYYKHHCTTLVAVFDTPVKQQRN
jgi:hypothetical protein